MDLSHKVSMDLSHKVSMDLTFLVAYLWNSYKRTGEQVKHVIYSTLDCGILGVVP